MCAQALKNLLKINLDELQANTMCTHARTHAVAHQHNQFSNTYIYIYVSSFSFAMSRLATLPPTLQQHPQRQQALVPIHKLTKTPWMKTQCLRHRAEGTASLLPRPRPLPLPRKRGLQQILPPPAGLRPAHHPRVRSNYVIRRTEQVLEYFSHLG